MEEYFLDNYISPPPRVFSKISRTTLGHFFLKKKKTSKNSICPEPIKF